MVVSGFAPKSQQAELSEEQSSGKGIPSHKLLIPEERSSTSHPFHCSGQEGSEAGEAGASGGLQEAPHPRVKTLIQGV